MMKKLLLAIPLIASASWAGASYYSGTQSQSAYDRLLSQLNGMNVFTLVNETYDSGFLNSTAVTRVMDSAAPDARILFRLQHQIDHSPVAVIDSNLRVAAASMKTTLIQDDSLPESAVEFLQGFVDSQPFQIYTEIGLDGKTDNQFLISAYKYEQNGVVADFAGLEYSALVQGDVFTGAGEVGAISFDRSGQVLRLAPGRIKSDLQRVSQGVYGGFQGVEFESLTFSSGEGMPVEVALGSIGLTSDTTIEQGLLASRAGLKIGSIDSPLPLNSLSFEVGMSRLSVAGIEQYIETVSQISIADRIFPDDPAFPQKMLAAFLPVIGPGTGLDYKLDFGNDGGNASLDYGISVIDDSSPVYPVGGLPALSTIRDVLNVVRLEAHLDADAEAIDQTPLAMFMMSPQAQQIILADGASYKADIVLSELIVDINGNPLSLEMMMGDMLDTPLADMM